MAARLPLPRRALLTVLLAAFLAAPAVLAAPLSPGAEDREPGFIAAVASELQAQLWSVLRLIWEKEGCSIDPHGNCVKSLVWEKAGCVIDPHGNCAESAAVTQGDAGCGLDPHGGCGH